MSFRSVYISVILPSSIPVRSCYKCQFVVLSWLTVLCSSLDTSGFDSIRGPVFDELNPLWYSWFWLVVPVKDCSPVMAKWLHNERHTPVLSTAPGAKIINIFRACLGAQLTICAQKWRNFVLFSTVSLRFVWSRVCVFLYSLGPRTLFVCTDLHW